MDNSKIGIHNGTRGRRASRKRKKRRGHQQYAQRQAVQAAKRKKLDDPPLDVDDYGASDEVEGAWRDVRAVLIFREEDLADTSESRRALLRRRVVAHIGTKEEWMKLLHMAFYEEGVYTAYEVVFLADGGNGIWETFTELLPQTRFRRVVQILDWYHAAAYVWKIGRAVKGYTTKQQQKACKKWVDGILKYLKAGKVANVIQRLQRLKNLSVEAQKVVDNGVVYFEKHRARVRYAWFRKRGLLIGSGPIESIHAWVIQARCCLPGMRWSLKGANIILRLRCSWASGRWDEDFLEAARGDPLSTQDLKLAAA